MVREVGGTQQQKTTQHIRADEHVARFAAYAVCGNDCKSRAHARAGYDCCAPGTYVFATMPTEACPRIVGRLAVGG